MPKGRAMAKRIPKKKETKVHHIHMGGAKMREKAGEVY